MNDVRKRWDIALVALIIVVLLIALFPDFTDERPPSPKTSCIVHSKLVVLSMIMYSSDFDD